MGKAQREAGKRYEREVAKAFRAVLGDAKRGWQSRYGSDDPDVITPLYSIECKHQKEWSWADTVKALAQAEDGRKLGTRPIAVIKRKRIKGKPRPGDGMDLVVMELEEFLDLTEELWELKNL